jgi:serine phosphatase RsbU (regulator of sigma subunit)
VEERLLAIAKGFWPELESMSGSERRDGVGNVVGFLYTAPLALAGLVWLIALTDLPQLRAGWPMLLLLFALLFVFERLGFYLFVEVTPGTYADWSASLGDIIIWSAALLFGPSALWLLVCYGFIYYARWWRRYTSTGARWTCLRNFTLNFAEGTVGSLIALTLYKHWGGTFPLPGLTLDSVLPAFYATFVWWLLSVLIWMPLLAYFGKSRISTGSSLGTALRFWTIAMGWDALVNPFAILAAGLHTQNGLGGYLFVVAGLLLASLLAHQLSQAAQRSQQRSRELEKLEQLGRAIINAGCCAVPAEVPTFLPDMLKEHVSNMFPYSQMEIRIFPDHTLLRHPEDVPATGAWTWEWLRTTSEAHYFPPGEVLPWEEQPARDAVVVAPILDVENLEAIGGIYLARRRVPATLATADLLPAVLPAVQSLAAQVASALNSAQVYEERLAHQRVEQELALAGQIQASFLPDDLPHVPGWQLAARLKPARETSGDFYDVIPLPNGQFAIAVADVADKGMGAALYMALSRTLIRTYGLECCTQPEPVLSAVNRRILMDTRAGMFVTVFYGILDPVTGKLTYCNAGHNPPYLLSAQNSHAVQTLGKTGMALGVTEDAAWTQGRVQLAPGDMLVFYTDGVTEAQNWQGAFFGEGRLIEIAQAKLGSPAQDVQDALILGIDDFVGDAPQFDDITLMVVVRDSGGVAT